jgi:hypothetical protein
MDSFPANFNSQSLQKHVLEDTVYGASQEALLKEERKRVYERICADFQRSDSIIIFDKALCVEMEKKLVSELRERFPGCVEYRHVTEYGDVGRFVKITDDKNPNFSTQYRVVLK